MHMKTTKAKVLLLSLILVLTVTVGGTVAYLVTGTSPLENIFKPSHVSCQVNDGYTVTNTGDIDAYIRVKVTVTWEDASGNIYGQAPGYTVTPGTDWFEGSDGYFYYAKAIAPNAATTCVYGSVTVNGTPAVPAEYTQTITVAAQAIQSVPDQAVEQAWPAVDANNGTLTGK